MEFAHLVVEGWTERSWSGASGTGATGTDALSELLSRSAAQGWQVIDLREAPGDVSWGPGDQAPWLEAQTVGRRLNLGLGLESGIGLSPLEVLAGSVWRRQAALEELGRQLEAASYLSLEASCRAVMTVPRWVLFAWGHEELHYMLSGLRRCGVLCLLDLPLRRASGPLFEAVRWQCAEGQWSSEKGDGYRLQREEMDDALLALVGAELSLGLRGTLSLTHGLLCDQLIPVGLR